MPYTYPFDPNGTLVSNLISNEIHSLTPPSSADAANFIVPTHGPFYANGLIVEKVNGSTYTPLILGTDYQLGAQWYEMRASFDRLVYAAINFTNRSLSGNVRITYQTVGGPYTDVDNTLLLNLAQSMYRLRLINWSQIVGPLVQFPVAPHNHSAEDVFGQQLVDKLHEIAVAIEGQQSNTLNEVITDTSLLGNGTSQNPLKANLVTNSSLAGKGTQASPLSLSISTQSGNLLDVRDDGLYYGIAAPPNVSNLYISTSLGNDTNPGTKEQPLKTIAKACSLVSGDTSSTFHLRAGETFTMDTKVYMSGTATRTLVPYDDPYYDGAVHDAVLADGAAHYPAFGQEVTRPIIRFNWKVVGGLNSTQTFSTGGWVCKDNSTVDFNGITLKMAQYPSGNAGVQRGVCASGNTAFLGSGNFNFNGCRLGYEFQPADNALGRFFRSSTSDVSSLSFVGTILEGAGTRDFLSISAGTANIRVKDNQSVVAGTTSQTITPMVGTAITAFTTRAIEGVVWGQDGIPTNIDANFAISEEGHLPAATTLKYGATRLPNATEKADPLSVPADAAVVYEMRDVYTLVQQIKSQFDTQIEKLKIQVGDIYCTNHSYPNSLAVRTDKGYGIWARYGEGKALVGEWRPDPLFVKNGFFGKAGTLMGHPVLPHMQAGSFTPAVAPEPNNESSLVRVLNTDPTGSPFGFVPYHHRPPSITSFMWERLREDLFQIRFDGSDPRLFWNLEHEKLSSFKYGFTLFNISTFKFRGSPLYAGLRLSCLSAELWTEVAPSFSLTLTNAHLTLGTDAYRWWWDHPTLLNGVAKNTSGVDPIYGTNPPLNGYGEKEWIIVIEDTQLGIAEVVGSFSMHLVPYSWNMTGENDDPRDGSASPYNAGYSHDGTKSS